MTRYSGQADQAMRAITESGTSTLDLLLESYPEGIPYDVVSRALGLTDMTLYDRMTALGWQARWLWCDDAGKHVQHWRRKT